MSIQWSKINKLHVAVFVVLIIVIINWYSIILLKYDPNWNYLMKSYLMKNSDSVQPAPNGLARPLKYILQWTLPYTQPFVFWGNGQDGFLKRKCRVSQCYITHNRSFLEDITEYDVIAFHGPEIMRYDPGPHKRSARQRYAYVSIESSHYYPVCDKRYDDFFNWTWTYRLDSDVPYPYITIRNAVGDVIGPNKTMNWLDVDSMKPVSDELKKRLNSKSKAAAWFVSNCDSKSKREVFVKDLQFELKKFNLEIDVFGKCGTKICPLETKAECLKMVERDYYFYLSLENSLAEDYVTEKLLTALQHYAVPVVLGGANYTRFMPDGIYLHGGQMSPATLAREMRDIIRDKERYHGFFQWRNHYSYHAPADAADTDEVCRMCEMLHDESLMTNYSSYKQFGRWWNRRICNAAYRNIGNSLQLLSLLAAQIVLCCKG